MTETKRPEAAMSLYTRRSKQTLLNEIYLYILLWVICIETTEKVSINYFLLNFSNQNLKELVFLITLLQSQFWLSET
jgi:hypothetical protein